MLVSKKNEEYIAPSLMVVNVACEEGYKASTGNVSFGGGVDDGWYSI